MGGRILVVDDNLVNLKLACVVLEAEGYAVERATSAEEALQVMRRVPPDLILMDVALPGRNGLELTRELKSDPATRPIRIIALTAFAMRGDEQRILEAGCDGYIAKPIDTRRLVVEVAARLPINVPMPNSSQNS